MPTTLDLLLSESEGRKERLEDTTGDQPSSMKGRVVEEPERARVMAGALTLVTEGAQSRSDTPADMRPSPAHRGGKKGVTKLLGKPHQNYSNSLVIHDSIPVGGTVLIIRAGKVVEAEISDSQKIYSVLSYVKKITGLH